MTVRKGADWGGSASIPDDLVVVRTDAQARHVLSEARDAGDALPAIGLLGGDLCRTLGGRGGDRARLRDVGTVAVVDLGIAVTDGVEHLFVAHLVLRRSWWWGRTVAVMNGQYVGDWDVAPRAHPGDGRLDVIDADLSLGDRWKARSRLAGGTHVPHPDIAQSRVRSWEVELDRAMPVRLDGEPVAVARHVEARVEPDAVRVVV